MILDVHPRLSCFSRMRSEEFVRLEWLVASSSGRRRVVVRSASRRRVVNSVSMGEAAKPLFFEGFQAGCHVVLRGRRGTLSHSNLFDNVSKVSKLQEVSHEMLVLLRPRISYRVSVVQSSTGTCFVQALQYKVVLGSALCKLCSTK